MIVQAEALKWLESSTTHFRSLMMDVPDNLGLAYAGVSDRRPDYYPWIERVIIEGLKRTDILVFTYNAIHLETIGPLLKKHARSRPLKTIIWTFTFGQYQEKCFSNCWRPIVIIGDDLNYDGIRIASSRMLSGDARANGPRVPGDVWEYPRVVGNSPERRSWHPTQLPEAMMERIVMLTSMRTEKGRTSPVGIMGDVFTGSGTTCIVCKRLGVPFVGVELSAEYYEQLKALEI